MSHPFPVGGPLGPMLSCMKNGYANGNSSVNTDPPPLPRVVPRLVECPFAMKSQAVATACVSREPRAQANGNSKVKTDPPPCRGSYQRSPPIARALCLASDNPSPVELSPWVGVVDRRT
jgi:hypothetical protein